MGSRLEGCRLVVLPCPQRPQSEKATSWDPLSSRDPVARSPSQRDAGGGVGGPARTRGPGSKWAGVPACGVLRRVSGQRGQEMWGCHEPGSPPHEPGPLAFSKRPFNFQKGKGFGGMFFCSLNFSTLEG